jgi:3-isopropylmalate/(R)-2-methylmalate dehydratase small subunit
MTVDLEEQSVAAANGTLHRFTIDAFRKQALLTGQDEIAFTLGYEKEIVTFEARRADEAPVPPE